MIGPIQFVCCHDCDGYSLLAFDFTPILIISMRVLQGALNHYFVQFGRDVDKLADDLVEFIGKFLLWGRLRGCGWGGWMSIVVRFRIVVINNRSEVGSSWY